MSLHPATIDAAHAGSLGDLARALERAGVGCCQWKGRWSQAHRPLMSDIDVLISPSDIHRFSAVAETVGFKMARPDARQYPGTLSWYAPSALAPKFIHLHLHYRLYVGHWLAPHRLPLEAPVLASARRTAALPLPSPEFELLLRVCWWASAREWRPSSAAARRRKAAAVADEIAYLLNRPSLPDVHDAAAAHLPAIDPDVCEAALLAMLHGKPDGGRPGRQLRRAIASLTDRTWVARAAHLFQMMPVVVARWRRRSHTPFCGGRVVAFVGGDGAGKSTAAQHTRDWLAGTFETAVVHLGLPPRSAATLAAGVLRRTAAVFGLGAAAPRGTLSVLRTVCTARDRYRLYRSLRARAERGTIVLCDRYPLPGLGPDGPAFGRSLPLPRTAVGRRLQRIESHYYRRIAPPDLVILLDVAPDVAARRKRDEDEAYVRTRVEEMCRQITWRRDPRVHVIDANRPLNDVLADVRRSVWEAL
jgi:thymidylate kinase